MTGLVLGVPDPNAAAPAAAAAPPKPNDFSKLLFTTVSAAALNHGIKVLVYGGAGSGKTRLCGTAPKPIIISAEAGLLTFKKMIEEGILDPNTPVIEVHDIDTVRTAYEWCKQNAAAQGIRTICLDSISEITEKCLAAAKAKTKDPRAAYGDMAGQTIELVKQFRDLAGFHILVTAKQTVATDPVTGVTKAQPTAPGQQVGPALPYLFDEVFHAYTDKEPTTGETYHALRTHAAFNAEAKDRSGVLAEVEFPDLAYIIGKILAIPTPPEAEPAPVAAA